MACCFCCLDEDERVGKVLAKFPSIRAACGVENGLNKLVGRVVALGGDTRVLYAPGSGRPCVYYHLTVEEECEVVDTSTDEDGNTQTTVRHEWREIMRDEQCLDFFIQDGTAKIFVNGSNRQSCRIQSETEGGSSGGWGEPGNPPPGVSALIGYRKSLFNFNGRIRYDEKVFEINELVAVLGVLVNSTNPYNQQPMRMLQPFDEKSLSDEWMEEQSWSKWDIRSWHALLENPAVLISDDKSCTEQVQVDPAQDLPPAMVTVLPAERLSTNQAIFQPVQAVVVAPVIVAQPVQPLVVAPTVVQVQPTVVAAQVTPVATVKTTQIVPT